MHLVTDTAPPCTLGNPSSMLSPPRPNMHLAQKACTHLKARVHLPRRLQPFLSLCTTQFYRLVWKRLSVPSVVCLAESRGLQNAGTNPPRPSSAIFLVEVQCCTACYAHAPRPQVPARCLALIPTANSHREEQRFAVHERPLKQVSFK